MHQSDTTSVLDGIPASGKLLSAFFGFDHALPVGSDIRICPGAAHQNGMPVIFDHELDVSTVQAGDFRVITRSGKVGSILCVTMMPAVDPGELRTALLVGDYGNARSDPPVKVEIAGNILSKGRTVNFKGASMQVTPLEARPAIVLAGSFRQINGNSARRAGFGGAAAVAQLVPKESCAQLGRWRKATRRQRSWRRGKSALSNYLPRHP
jgi:hypothetical protein